MGSIIRDAVTQYWSGKVRSLSNERWLKRARGAARKRDKSRYDCTIIIVQLTNHFAPASSRRALPMIRPRYVLKRLLQSFRLSQVGTQRAVSKCADRRASTSGLRCIGNYIPPLSPHDPNMHTCLQISTWYCHAASEKEALQVGQGCLSHVCHFLNMRCLKGETLILVSIQAWCHNQQIAKAIF